MTTENRSTIALHAFTSIYHRYWVARTFSNINRRNYPAPTIDRLEDEMNQAACDAVNAGVPREIVTRTCTRIQGSIYPALANYGEQRAYTLLTWIASAELVDAIPPGDQHGPTYDQLLRSAAEDSYEAERRLRLKDGDWTPETYAPHHAALERYYELYKLAPAWQRVIAGSVA